ncbi:MAG: hypothetical protein HY347_09485 [candidate division NC10 bacterium]|nr:hypothetical protein [candidate division NC10 bacterium]
MRDLAREALTDASKTIRIPDELLDYYGDLFMQSNLRRQGVVFERFLACPDYYFKKLAVPLGHDEFPSPGEKSLARPWRWFKIVRFGRAARSP